MEYDVLLRGMRVFVDNMYIFRIIGSGIAEGPKYRCFSTRSSAEAARQEIKVS